MKISDPRLNQEKVQVMRPGSAGLQDFTVCMTQLSHVLGISKMAATRTEKHKISSAETSTSRNHNSNGGSKRQKTNNRNCDGGGNVSSDGGGSNGNDNRNSMEGTYKGTIEDGKYCPKHVYATFSKEQRREPKKRGGPGKRSIKAVSSDTESGAEDSHGQYSHTKETQMTNNLSGKSTRG